jgi:MOSC domain-containing protein YiiM
LYRKRVRNRGGSNLTTEGLLESDVRLGDRFRVGSSEFVVTQPRLPRVSRTRADLEGHDDVKLQNIAELAGYWSLNRSVWA